VVAGDVTDVLQVHTAREKSATIPTTTWCMKENQKKLTS
jgi:hypothetical protein